MTNPPFLSRREMLQRSGCGFGLLALTDLLAAETLVPKKSETSEAVSRLWDHVKETCVVSLWKSVVFNTA